MLLNIKNLDIHVESGGKGNTLRADTLEIVIPFIPPSEIQRQSVREMGAMHGRSAARMLEDAYEEITQLSFLRSLIVTE